jgi:hypothetical protein
MLLRKLTLYIVLSSAALILSVVNALAQSKTPSSAGKTAAEAFQD